MKEQNIVNFYVTCLKLKNIIRTGWLNWHVKPDTGRLESVAEHIYGTQMLALAIYSEYKEYYQDLDIMKIIYMLAIHEIGEASIGDLTQFQITKDEKKKIELDAVHKTLAGLNDGEYIETLWLDFDNHSSKEAWFAYLVDKLECDIQSKLYNENGVIDLTNQEDNISYYNELVQKLLKGYENDPYAWSKMWLSFGQEKYNYDQPFIDISNYVINNEISLQDEKQNHKTI